MVKNTTRVFGKEGKEAGKFFEPAGITCDGRGKMIVADAGNHRLQVRRKTSAIALENVRSKRAFIFQIFDKNREYIGTVKLDHRLQRPSGLLFDPNGDDPAIYVLNLRGNNMQKFRFV